MKWTGGASGSFFLSDHLALKALMNFKQMERILTNFGKLKFIWKDNVSCKLSPGMDPGTSLGFQHVLGGHGNMA